MGGGDVVLRSVSSCALPSSPPVAHALDCVDRPLLSSGRLIPAVADVWSATAASGTGAGRAARGRGKASVETTIFDSPGGNLTRG
mmetsp:Transcript_18092/g.46266  ORF Transcript_18092/g.46266 Transcript_18092/m.46266 type:complete len:85 (-) Transcript_18092:278-532(-)